MIHKTFLAAIVMTAGAAMADDGARRGCAIPAATVEALQLTLDKVVTLDNGGLFTPSRMWSAVVDRNGILCSVHKQGDAFPGSRAIAIAKAETGNDFSNSALALSTANLYVGTQPGGSLYGLNNSNPFNPAFNTITTGDGPGSGVGFNPGGVITFGGGLGLYSNGRVIGGLGVSGDTSCADHVIAYRMRRLAHLDHVPGGVGADNIQYPTGGNAPTGSQHPHCSPNDIPPGSI